MLPSSLAHTDDSIEVVEQFKIAGIPTVLAFRQGEDVARVTGAQNEAGYRALFDALNNTHGFILCERL